MPRRKRDYENEVVSRETAVDSMAFINNLPDPDRVLEKLGISADDAFKDLMQDDQLTTVMGTRVAAIKGMNWDLNIQEGTTDNILKANQDMLHKLNRNHQGQGISRLMDDILQANPWGMSVQEVIWKITGESWDVSEVKGRPFRYFTFNDENELRFLSKEHPTEGEEVPDYKLLLSRHWITSNSYDNPYGDKLLSKSYWPIILKRQSTQFWQVFLEKFGMPWVIAKVPTSYDETKKSRVATSLANMVQDGVLVITNDGSVDIQDPAGRQSSSDTYLNCLAYMDKALAKIWLGQTLTTDVGTVGSYAASQTHQGVKDERRNQDKSMIEGAIQTLCDWYTLLNFGENAIAPQFKLTEPLGVNKELADRDKTLSESGVKFTKVYYQRNYGLEEDEFEIKEEQQTEPVNNSRPGITLEQFAKSAFSDQAAIDKMLDTLPPEELQKQAQGLLKPIIKLVQDAKDYDEILDELLTTYPDMNSSAAENMLTRAYFVSEMIGRING